MEQTFIGFIGWDRDFIEKKFIPQCHSVCKVDNSESICSALIIHFCSLNIFEAIKVYLLPLQKIFEALQSHTVGLAIT